MVKSAYFLLAVLLGSMIGFVAGQYVIGEFSLFENRSGPAVAPVRPLTSNSVTALGRITPRRGVLALTVPLPDTVQSIEVEEGQTVKEGDVLVVLASHGEREREYGILRQQYQEAVDQYKLTELNFGEKIGQLQLQKKKVAEIDKLTIDLMEIKVRLLKDQLKLANDTWHRVRQLSGYSQQEREKQELLQKDAEAKFRSAEVELDQGRKSWQNSLAGVDAEIKSTQALKEKTLKEIPTELLRRKAELAEFQMQKARLQAPYGGKVLKVEAHKGELVGAQRPILCMADTSGMMVIAEVYQSEIHRVTKGDRAVMTISNRGGVVLTGKVSHVSSMVGKNRIFPLNPLQEVDRRVVEVHINLDEPEQPSPTLQYQGGEVSVRNDLAGGLIDHEVQVEIQTQAP